MSTLPVIYSDQFAQNPIKGDLDLTISKSGVIAGVLYSATATDTFDAGSRVKLYTSYAVNGGLPRFVAAIDAEAAFGIIKRTPQKAQFAVGDVVEIVMAGNPSVIWLCAGQTVTPFLSCGLSSGFVVTSSGSYTAFGRALDYGTDSQMVRVIIGYQSC